jgi:hypothetical protein
LRDLCVFISQFSSFSSWAAILLKWLNSSNIKDTFLRHR